MKRVSKWLPVLLFLPSLAGCIGNPSANDSGLGVGFWATYEGDDGSLLRVEVATIEVRWDALLRPHESLVLDYQFTPAVNEDGEPFRFEEAVDRSDGRLVQQVALCGLAFPSSPSGGTVTCHDDRALLFFGATGMPGALGMGPIWTGSSASAWPVADPSSKGRVVRHVVDAGDGCNEYRYEVEEGHAQRIRMLAWTMASSHMVACPGEAFPRTFQTSIGHHSILRSDGQDGRVAYQRTDAGPEGDRIEPSPVSAWNQTGGLPLRDLHPQYLFDGPSDHPTLTVEEAHQAAINQSATYADVMQDGGVVISFDHTNRRSGGGFAPGQGEQQTFEAVMKAVRPDGSGVRVALEKSRTLLLDRSIEDTRVTSDGNTEAPFHRSERGVDFDTAVAAAQIHNGDMEPADMGIRHGVERQPHAWTDFPGDWQQQEYEVYAQFRPPRVAEQEGITAYYPYEAVVGGTSGAWLLLNIEQSALPFAPPV